MSSINLPLILTLAVIFTGAVWLYDILVLAKVRREKSDAVDKQFAKHDLETSDIKAAYAQAKSLAASEPVLVEYSKSFFPVLFIVFFLRSFLIEPFQIPSGSMIPTLKVGDFILVNKFAYGIRLPVLNTQVIPVDKPKRGDVMVFFPPDHPDTYYIKRVIGLPGDTIRYTNNQLYINDQEMPQTFIANKTPEPASFCAQVWSQLSVTEEDLGTKKHIMQKCHRPGPLSVDGTWVVPDGHYFMMGDNRDNSLDSRGWQTSSFVSENAIVGKAFAVWMHWEKLLSIPSFNDVGMIQ